MTTKTVSMQEFHEEQIEKDEKEKNKWKLLSESDNEKTSKLLRKTSPDSPAWTGWWW